MNGSASGIKMASTCLFVWLAVVGLVPWLVTAKVEVMKDVTLGFGEALQHCREQSQLTEEMMEEFFHFWRDDFKFEHRELGCAIWCMSRHFDLLTDSHRMHHENTDKFIKTFPNGDVLSKQMVTIIHACEQKYEEETDHCSCDVLSKQMVTIIHACEQKYEEETDHCWRILRVAECFKKTCTDQGIAPTMEMLMAEFIMESEA